MNFEKAADVMEEPVSARTTVQPPWPSAARILCPSLRRTSSLGTFGEAPSSLTSTASAGTYLLILLRYSAADSPMEDFLTEPTATKVIFTGGYSLFFFFPAAGLALVTAAFSGAFAAEVFFVAFLTAGFFAAFARRPF